MSWGESRAFCRRPIVVVEDHLYHITQLLQALAELAPALLDQVTVLCLERPGPDTEATAGRWLASYPELQVAAAVPSSSDLRSAALDPEVFTAANAFCRARWQRCSGP